MEIVTFLNKWLHLLSITGVVGGLAASYFVVSPVLQSAGLGDSDQARSIRRKLGMYVGMLWVLVLLTGGVNTWLVWSKTTPAYHGELMGKIALAVIMFAISLALGHTARNPSAAARRRGAMMLAAVILGALILGVSARLNISRVSGKGLVKAAEVTK